MPRNQEDRADSSWCTRVTIENSTIHSTRLAAQSYLINIYVKYSIEAAGGIGRVQYGSVEGGVTIPGQNSIVGCAPFFLMAKECAHSDHGGVI
eukprot:11176534-Ditylum_brightwellii.AAC.1